MVADDLVGYITNHKISITARIGIETVLKNDRNIFDFKILEKKHKCFMYLGIIVQSLLIHLGLVRSNFTSVKGSKHNWVNIYYFNIDKMKFFDERIDKIKEFIRDMTVV